MNDFALYHCVPNYDDRDSISHSVVRRVSLHATIEAACSAIPADDDQPGDDYYFVAAEDDPFRKRLSNPAIAADDDIPF